MQGKGEEGEEEKNHSRDRRKEGRMTGVRRKREVKVWRRKEKRKQTLVLHCEPMTFLI